MVALLVARPLVIGEDPGLTDTLSNPWTLTFTQLWIVLAVGWAVWRAWSGQGWRGSAVEMGLAVVIGLTLLSATVTAPYKHAAWLVSWEWATCLVVYCVVRQLCRTPAEDRRLLAALVASAVSLSVHAVWQYGVELPSLRAQLGTGYGGLQSDPEKLRQHLAASGVFVDPGDPQLETLDKRVHENNIFATFSHPNAFAGFLALLLPAAIGAAVASCQRAGAGRGVATTLCAALVAGGLALTHSRGAILGILLVGAGVALWLGRRWLWAHKSVAWAGAATLLLGGLGVYALEARIRRDADPSAVARATRTVSLRMEYWTATVAMIRDHPWLGVGPGNYGRFLLRYLSPTASETVKDPHNFALEVWATAGIGALAGLLATLAMFFWRVGSFVFRTPAERELRMDAEMQGRGGVFYLGGMFGLLLGFALWAAGQTGGKELVYGGWVAGVRALIWFLAFAALGRAPWTARGRALALAAGAAALLLNLLVSGGISFPSVAQPIWAVAALAVNAVSPPALRRSRPSWPALTLPVPLLTVVCLSYWLGVFGPVTRCRGTLKRVQTYQQFYLRAIAAGPQRAPAGLRDKPSAAGFLDRQVIRPLGEATREDPGDIAPRLELARWYQSLLLMSQPWDEQDARLKRMVAAVQQVDPESVEGYLLEYQMWLLFADRAQGPKQGYYQKAIAAMREVIGRDPAEARMHAMLATALFLTGDLEEGKREAERALKLDQAAQDPSRRLTRPQRKDLARKLEARPIH